MSANSHKKVLVTGGLGFIGSHIVVELLANGHEVVVVDDCSRSLASVKSSIELITLKPLRHYKVDVCNESELEKIFVEQSDIDTVIHCAGFKSISESISKPLEYYRNNVMGTLSLLHVMEKHGVREFLFSSSATVYGDQSTMPIDESCEVGGVTNPYGATKYIVELMLSDLAIKNPQWQITVLRYFNPVGAHSSGLIGESAGLVPGNLVPNVALVALGEKPLLNVYGDDYPTKDGSAIRDYIHVMDLAAGHVKAIECIKEFANVSIYNLGTGVGHSVYDVVNSFEKVTGIDIPCKIMARREGDVAECWANVDKAEHELGWSAKYSLTEMVTDTWRWYQRHNHH